MSEAQQERQKGIDEDFCSSCGSIIKKAAKFCPHCGARKKIADDATISDKNRLVALLLAIFLGFLGIHRFYVGKIGTGILMLFFSWLTFGIWPLIDIIIIAVGDFTDIDGKKILLWETRY